MPDYTWGHVYAAGDNCLSGEAWRPFVAAMNERRRAVWLLPLHASSTLDAADAVPGLSALSAAVVGGNRNTPVYPATVASTSPLTITFDAIDLAFAGAPDGPYTVDATAWDVGFTPGIGDPVLATGTDPATIYPTDHSLPWSWRQLQVDIESMAERFLDPVAFAMAGETDPDAFGARLSDRATFPGVNGWTRKREREITSLAASGTDGWRARYVWTSGVSPGGEIDYGTKIMLRSAGTWMIDTDQATPPDIVTSYGLAQAGDLFGPWILADLKSAIDEMIWTAGAQPVISVGGGFLYGGSQTSSAGPESTIADAKSAAEAAFPGAVGAGAYEQVSGGPGQSYTVSQAGSDYFADIVQFVGRCVALRVPSHVSRTFTFYVHSTGLDEFDDNDTGLVDGQFVSWETLGPTADATPKIGTVDIGDETRVPDGPAGVASRGYQVNAVFTVVKWDVTGGFAYTAATP